MVFFCRNNAVWEKNVNPRFDRTYASSFFIFARKTRVVISEHFSAVHPFGKCRLISGQSRLHVSVRKSVGGPFRSTHAKASSSLKMIIVLKRHPEKTNRRRPREQGVP